MALQTLNVGTTVNDGTGDPLRTGMIKVNSNFTEVGSRLAALEGAALTLITSGPYTLTSADSGRTLEVSAAGSITINVPTGLPAGFATVIIQSGAGQVTLTPAGGVTLSIRGGATLNHTAGQYAVVSLTRLSATDSFVLAGDVA
jgi:hypothetical protein